MGRQMLHDTGGRSSMILKSRYLRRMLLVAIVSGIAISGIIIADISHAAYQWDLQEPTLEHGFPETVYFYNIGEGVTANRFSLILTLPANRSGHHVIVPREVTLLFKFRDASHGNDLSQFIFEVERNLWNSTLGISLLDYDWISLNESGWYAPSLLRIVLHDIPRVFAVGIGLLLSLVVVNELGVGLDGHELQTQLMMNVTYARWWNGLRVAPSHQTVSYTFDLPNDGISSLESIEY